MDGLANKISSFLVALMLAVTCCLAPYAQTAYAIAQLAIPAGQALAAVLAVLGVSVAINSDDDASALWSDWELFTDDIDAMAEGVGKLQDTAIANGNLVNATKSNVSQQEIDSINGVFSAAGEAGSFALDQLSIWLHDGTIGILPFLLSLFIDDQLATAGSSLFSFGDFDFRMTDKRPITGYSKYYQLLFFTYNNYQYSMCLYNGMSYHDAWFLSMQDGGFGIGNSYLSNQQIMIYDGSSWNFVTGISGYKYDVGGLRSFLGMADSDQYFPVVLPLSLFNNVLLYNKHSISFSDSVSGLSAKFDPVSGVWTGDVTDNPDVNLGHNWWTDAKDKANADLLDPAAGGAVIGSDAVFDGDYIKNRGSIAIPTDWGGINSWADALGATHAGVAEGVLDGTISKTHTGTATDTATGELVTDTVGTITKPGANTSVAVPVPGLFDGVVDAVDDKFPFCIPGDLHKCIATLGSAPVAPSFDWTFPLHHLGLQDVTIHIDLAPFDSVALILRIGLSVTMSIGLIFLSIRLLNLWGGK